MVAGEHAEEGPDIKGHTYKGKQTDACETSQKGANKPAAAADNKAAVKAPEKEKNAVVKASGKAHEKAAAKTADTKEPAQVKAAVNNGADKKSESEKKAGTASPRPLPAP